MTAEAKAIWDDVAMIFPEAMDRATFFSTPKPNSRKPDSSWDNVVRGADIQGVWVQNADGEMEREIDGKLDSYNLRVKKVDPSKLGVDKVKQFSGYLDDEENDKHLFYCECRLDLIFFIDLLLTALGFFESRNNPESDPVVLWLNGGVSSFSCHYSYFMACEIQ